MKPDQLALINGTANGGFQRDDIINATALVHEIEASDKPLTLHLREQFARAHLLPVPESAGTEPEKFKGAVVDTLNRIIGGDALYTEDRFAHVKLSAYTRKLLRKNPAGAKLISLNKLLLLDALPKQFRRKPGRGKNRIQKPATVHHLNNGKWAVLLTLVEPREIEGKMRSGDFKRERQTEGEANDLCAEINAVIFGKELARQLTPAEIAIAKKLLWEILEPRHPDWIGHLDKLVDHGENTGFRVDNNAPPIFEAVKLFWEEHVRGLEPESRMNYRNAFGFLLPAFGEFKTFQLTDTMVRQLAYGKAPLVFWSTSWKKKQTREEAEKRLWDTPIKSKSQRPWTHEMQVRFISCVRALKTWMHESLDPQTQEQRNWCPATALKTPKPPKIVSGNAGNDEQSDEMMEYLARKHPALTIPQSQAILDVSHIAFDGRFAGFYAHGLFGGTRVKETKKMGVNGFDPQDGVQAVTTQAAKKDQARESTLYGNLVVIIEALKAASLYTNQNLKPNVNQRAVIHVLAGFTSNGKQVHARVARERKRLAKLGIVLPDYNWGIPFPKNALRRTALSMHFKLYGDERRTKEWAGNGDVFRPYYKRLVSKEQAAQYWVMLTSQAKADGVKVMLPPDHKLDSAMTPELSAAAKAAGESMKAAMAKIAEVKAKAEAARPTELKARQAIYNKRAYLKRKAKQVGGQQAKPQPEPSPAGNGS